LTENVKIPYSISLATQLALFWNMMHLVIARYGNQSMGQLLVTLTVVFLDERGMRPTLKDLCDATGLPKTSISRYVSWHIKAGLFREVVDPRDRRRRFLTQTAKGKRERRWQLEEMEKLFGDMLEQVERHHETGIVDSALVVLEKMINRTKNIPPRFR
jgi:DNA-binding MarR family transcriptional regulator